ncbi:hypothetical protein [Microbacterium helvum]|uniref:hypothetical protein n=1 Tax=Microbacterium helvum TaxID=2773713 RepID=UPI001CD0B64A|nr:hypothetical protein [Microbacterium helvum]
MSGITQRLESSLERAATRIRGALDAPERTPRTAVVLGRIVGVGFAVCFLTGIYSHLQQHPIAWLPLPTRPIELYAWSQGLHVAVGTALLPLVLAKLWVVYPRLFAWPPVRSVADLLERGSVALLVSTALLQLVMGTLNTFQWYPWPFSFVRTHWALSWVVSGAIVVHLAVKLPIIVRHWHREAASPDAASDVAGDAEGES